MIRFIHCMRRRPELTAAEFREYWNSPEFADLVSRNATALGAVKVSRNLTYNIELTSLLMSERGSTEEAYDAIMEMWWLNPAELESIRDSAEVQKLQTEMKAYQERFVDFSRSQRFLTEWMPDS